MKTPHRNLIWRAVFIVYSLTLFAMCSETCSAQPLENGMGSLAFEAVAQAWQLKTGELKQYAGEVSLPFYLFLDVHRRAQVRVSGAGASYVNFQEFDTETGQTDTTSTLSGMTNFRVEADYSLSSRFMIGLNTGLPTGRTSLSDEEERAIALFVRPELASRVPRPGSGFDIGGQIAAAFPLNTVWIAAASAGYQARGAYTAREGGVEIDPGDELLGSLGLDYQRGNLAARLAGIYTTFSPEMVNGIDHFQSGEKIEAKLAAGVRTGMTLWSFSFRHIQRSANSLGTDLLEESENSNSPFTIARLAADIQVARQFHVIPSLHSRSLAANESDAGEANIYGGGLEFAFPSNSADLRIFLSGSTGSVNDGDTDVLGGAMGARLAFRL